MDFYFQIDLYPTSLPAYRCKYSSMTTNLFSQFKGQTILSWQLPITFSFTKPSHWSVVSSCNILLNFKASKPLIFRKWTISNLKFGLQSLGKTSSKDLSPSHWCSLVSKVIWSINTDSWHLDPKHQDHHSSWACKQYVNLWGNIFFLITGFLPNHPSPTGPSFWALL